jgi:hypothetical protein
MVTIESSSALLNPGARTLVTIEDSGANPSIRVSADEVKFGKDLNFAPDPSRKEQSVSFFGIDGPVELLGRVPDEVAVSFPGRLACKVVLAVELTVGLTSAFEKGDRSRSYVSLRLVKVLEVWEDSKAARYVAPGWAATSAPTAQKTLDLSSGRVAAK